MIGIDSNVLVRVITRDDPDQTTHADRILDASDAGGIFVSLIVLAETAWALRRAYRYGGELVLAAIQRILDAREFTVELSALAPLALDGARAAGCGYADALIEAIHREAGAEPTYTFDIRAKRLPTMRDARAF